MAIALNACHALGQEPAVDYDIHWLNRPDGLLRRSRARTDIIGKLIGSLKCHIVCSTPCSNYIDHSGPANIGWPLLRIALWECHRRKESVLPFGI